jgi:acetoin utilization deacetylase AcuC-like enzyme
MLFLAAAPELDHHDTGPGHPERRARLHAALDGIAEAGLSDAVVQLEPRRATEEELELVHPASYLESVRSFCETGGGALDPDTIVREGSWDTALLAAGATLAAIDALNGDAGDVAFVCERPPGHHATADEAMGFCIVNNVAVAAAALADRGEKVIVVDWDVHHGNGTQAIFWDDPRVLYVSTHQFPLYPGTGRAEETGGPGAPGLTVNIPLPAGATGDVLLRAFDEVVAPVADRFDATWVLVSAGFDAHRADPLAGLGLTAGDFADLALRVIDLVPGRKGPVFVLEGGYDLAALRTSVGASLSAALGHRFRPEPASSGGPGTEAVALAGRLHDSARGG